MGSPSALQALSTHRTNIILDSRLPLIDCRIKKLLRLLCDGIVVNAWCPFSLVGRKKQSSDEVTSAFQALSTRRTSMILDCRLGVSTVELKSFYVSCVMGSSSALKALSTHRTKETIVRRGNFSAPSPIYLSDEYDPRLSIGAFDCRIKKLLRLLCDGIVISVPSPFYSSDERNNRQTR